jgi:hypothetical protein
MSRHLTYYIFQEFLSEAFEQFSHSEIGLSEKLAHVTGIPSLSTQFHKNALEKALMFWRIELLRLERSGNLIDLSEFTHFRFLEAALTSEVEKRLWRSYLGYDQNGVVNSNSSISPAFSDFVLSEALPSAELRYNRILNICKTEVRSTGRFRKSCRHIASWMLTSKVLKVRQLAQRLIGEIDRSRIVSEALPSLGTQEIVTAVAAGGLIESAGLKIYQGLRGGFEWLRKLPLHWKVGMGSAASHLAVLQGLNVHQQLAATKQSSQKQAMVPTSPQEKLIQSFVPELSFYDLNKIDYLATQVLSSQLEYNVTQMTPALLWGEWLTRKFERVEVNSETELEIAGRFAESVANEMVNIELMKRNVQERLNFAGTQKLNTDMIVQVLRPLQLRMSQYKKGNEWFHFLLNSPQSVFKVDCVGQTLLMISYLDEISQKYFPQQFTLSMEVFQNHIRPVIVSKSSSVVWDLVYNRLHETFQERNLLEPRALYQSWLNYRWNKYVDKDYHKSEGGMPKYILSWLESQRLQEKTILSLANHNPFVKYLKSSNVNFPSPDIDDYIIEPNLSPVFSNETLQSNQNEKTKSAYSNGQKESYDGSADATLEPPTIVYYKPSVNYVSEELRFPFRISGDGQRNRFLVIGPSYPEFNSRVALVRQMTFEMERILQSREWKQFVEDLRAGRELTGTLKLLNDLKRVANANYFDQNLSDQFRVTFDQQRGALEDALIERRKVLERAAAKADARVVVKNWIERGRSSDDLRFEKWLIEFQLLYRDRPQELVDLLSHFEVKVSDLERANSPQNMRNDSQVLTSRDRNPSAAPFRVDISHGSNLTKPITLTLSHRQLAFMWVELGLVGSTCAPNGKSCDQKRTARTASDLNFFQQRVFQVFPSLREKQRQSYLSLHQTSSRQRACLPGRIRNSFPCPSIPYFQVSIESILNQTGLPPESLLKTLFILPTPDQQTIIALNNFYPEREDHLWDEAEYGLVANFLRSDLPWKLLPNYENSESLQTFRRNFEKSMIEIHPEWQRLDP